MNKLTIAVTALLLGLFVWGLCEAHEIHLSDMDQPQHQISLKGCSDGSYAVESKEYGCYRLFKHTDIDHMGLHVEFITLDQDGDCSCPNTRGE